LTQKSKLGGGKVCGGGTSNTEKKGSTRSGVLLVPGETLCVVFGGGVLRKKLGCGVKQKPPGGGGERKVDLDPGPL